MNHNFKKSYPGPAWTRSAEVKATRDVIDEINRAADQRDALLASLFPADVLRDAQHLQPSTAQVDPASFRHQLEQARAAIRELLGFIDTKDALIRDLCETVIWLDSDECNDAHEWPAFVQRVRGILTSGYEVPT